MVKEFLIKNKNDAYEYILKGCFYLTTFDLDEDERNKVLSIIRPILKLYKPKKE